MLLASATKIGDQDKTLQFSKMKVNTAKDMFLKDDKKYVDALIQLATVMGDSEDVEKEERVKVLNEALEILLRLEGYVLTNI